MQSRVARTCAVALAVVLGGVAAARADSLSIGFENPPYTAGSIDGQDNWGGQNPPGIAINPAIDQAVSTTNPRTGSQHFRISSFFTSGSFGDQTFSPSLTDGAGEPGAYTDGFTGGTLQPRFISTIHFASATLSGASVNPARSIGSALVGGDLDQVLVGAAHT